MTYSEICDLIESLGLPFAYAVFPDGTQQAPPFLCLLITRDDVLADGVVYAKKGRLHIELYTDTKDFALEKRIEDLLQGAQLPYQYEDGYIEAEHMRQTVYTVPVLLDD